MNKIKQKSNFPELCGSDDSVSILRFLVLHTNVDLAYQCEWLHLFLGKMVLLCTKCTHLTLRVLINYNKIVSWNVAETFWSNSVDPDLTAPDIVNNWSTLFASTHT